MRKAVYLLGAVLGSGIAFAWAQGAAPTDPQCLGIPAETVRSRHFRAKGLLREALAREVDIAERSLWEFAGERCDRIVARVLSRLPEAAE